MNVSCKICGKSFEKYQQIGPHVQFEHIHNPHPSTLAKIKKVEEYKKNPRLCRRCQKPLSYEEKQSKKVFCSHTCSAISSNEKRAKKRVARVAGALTNPSIGCNWCGKQIIDFKFKNRKFCSLSCFQQHRTQENINIWLKTNNIPSYTGGKTCSAPTGFVRNYILKDQNFLCAECRSPQTHHNKPLTFVLDHIDGNATHNGRDNLRLLCPNCDSQSSTYKGRNKGKGRRSLGFSANKGM